MKLHSFFNSSTSYRARIALALKGLPFDLVPVNIRTGGHRTADYLAMNPGGSVPTLVDDDFALGQSLAIIDWLDSVKAAPRLIPLDPVTRARALEVAYAVACDIHPVNNLRVLRYLKDVLKVDDAARDAWYRHWIAEGLGTVETLLVRHGHGSCCFGEQPDIADCCLIPQVANALRMKCDVDAYPRVMAIWRHCSQLPAFIQAAPATQPDFSA